MNGMGYIITGAVLVGLGTAAFIAGRLFFGRLLRTLREEGKEEEGQRAEFGNRTDL